MLVKAAHVMKGYWNNPVATTETIRDGWLHTGDIALRDAEGFITIHDRVKDMIISGGENVCPAELENVIATQEGMADVAVIGRDSERWGESPFAVVVAKNEGLTEADILKHCDGKLARFKQPKGVAFIDEIPRNPTGKRLQPLTQTALTLVGNMAYHDYEGIALDHEERERLVADLGQSNTMILRNHGTLTCGETVADAFTQMFTLERACAMQIRVLSGGVKLNMRAG